MTAQDRISTLKPFEPGDIFAACTLLDDPKDDHAGPGRIFQYDANLKEKGVLWTEGTTHLVNGLTFAPDGTLWGFDQHAYAIIKVGRDGKQVLPNPRFLERSLSHVNFGADGSLYFGEHLRGDTAPATMGTHLPFMPGTKKFGDGHIFKFSPDGKLLAEYATETHGGMAGFLGVTSSVLTPDGKRVLYVTETGNKIFQFDLEANRQLPDLATFPPGREGMVFFLAYTPDGRLLASRGSRVDVIDDKTGAVGASMVQGDTFGWATLCPSQDNVHIYAGNFFTGELAKFVFSTGAKVASVQLGVARSLAGVAEFKA